MGGYDDDEGERARVRSLIGPLIMDFSKQRAGRKFHVEDLRRYVRGFFPDIAPDSPGRILRDLRQCGKLYYVVINRRQSLYQFRKKPLE